MSIGKLLPQVTLSPQPPRAAPQKAAATFVPTPPAAKPVLYVGRVSDMIKAINNGEYRTGASVAEPVPSRAAPGKLSNSPFFQADRAAFTSAMARASGPSPAKPEARALVVQQNLSAISNRPASPQSSPSTKILSAPMAPSNAAAATAPPHVQTPKPQLPLAMQAGEAATSIRASKGEQEALETKTSMPPVAVRVGARPFNKNPPKLSRVTPGVTTVLRRRGAEGTHRVTGAGNGLNPHGTVPARASELHPSKLLAGLQPAVMAIDFETSSASAGGGQLSWAAKAVGVELDTRTSDGVRDATESVLLGSDGLADAISLMSGHTYESDTDEGISDCESDWSYDPKYDNAFSEDEWDDAPDTETLEPDPQMASLRARMQQAILDFQQEIEAFDHLSKDDQQIDVSAVMQYPVEPFELPARPSFKQLIAERSRSLTKVEHPATSAFASSKEKAVMDEIRNFNFATLKKRAASSLQPGIPSAPKDSIRDQLMDQLRKFDPKTMLKHVEVASDPPKKDAETVRAVGLVLDDMIGRFGEDGQLTSSDAPIDVTNPGSNDGWED